MHIKNRFILCLCLLAFVTACSSDPSKEPRDAVRAKKEDRIPVMMPESQLAVDESLSGFDISLPEPAVNIVWPQTGGNIGHAPENPAIRDELIEVWASSVGSGSDRRYKLLASPIVAENTVFTMDSVGRVSAFDMVNGDRIWRVETTPPYREGRAMGGGIAYEKGVVYASTGFGEIIALQAKSGISLWRKSLGKPLRSAPTVSEGRLFVITIENETYALDAATGRVLWRHSGIAENAALMGASSPAVHGDTVVVAYSSGELFGLRTQNGRVVWGEVLAVPTQKGALPAIADIRGLPVIEQGRVFAISHSGRMVAIDERSGGRVWESDLGGFNTPCVSGNAVFVATNDNELVALTRDTGQVIWFKQLERLEDPTDAESKPLVWWGPVLAGNKLWLTNSRGFIASFDPSSGEENKQVEVAEPFFLPPVVAQRTMFLLSDDGRLRAFK